MAITQAGLDAALELLDATVYLEVHDGVPGADGSTNQVIATDRPAIAFGAPETDGDYRRRRGPSATPIVVEDPGAGTYQAWSIWTAASGGACLWVVPFAENRTLSAGDDLRAAVDAVSCRIKPEV